VTSREVFTLRVEEAGTTREIRLERLPVTLGRGEEAEIRISGERCSRRHARLEETRAGVLLVDLDSRNGTFVKGERIHQALVRPGETFTIGDARLTLLGKGTAEAVDLSSRGIHVVEEIAEGMTSRVFLARQDAMGRDVIVKSLHERLRGDLQAAVLFKERVREQARVTHGVLASVIDSGEEDGVPYCVLERLEGLTAREMRSQGPIAERMLIRVLGGLLELCEHLHDQGRCLSALHPERVVIGDDGRTGVTGLGYPFPKTEEHPHAFLEALSYLAPEAAHRPRRAGPAADLFLVGALLRFLIAGEAPRSAGSVTDMVEQVAARPLPPLAAGPAVSRGLAALVEGLSAHDPGGRPATARAALAEVARLESALGVPRAGREEPQAAADGERRRGGMSRRKFKVVSWGITIFLMLVLNGAVFFWFKEHGHAVTAWFQSRNDVEAEEENEQPPVETAASVAEAEQDRDAARGEEERRLRERRFAEMSGRLVRDLEAQRFQEAASALEEFTNLHPGTPEAARAAERLASVEEAWRSRVEGLLSRMRERLAAKDARGAHELRQEALSMGAGRILPAEFERLTGELTKLVESAPESPPDSTGEERDPDPAEPARSGGSLPRASWEDALAVALDRPGDEAARKVLLEALDKEGEPGRLAPAFAILKAQGRVLEALRTAVAAGGGPQLDLETGGGKRLKGRVRGVDGEALVLEDGGEEERLSLRDLPPRGWLALVGALRASSDRYLVSAWLHLKVGEREEAWFDLQGARLLADEGGETHTAATLLLQHLSDGRRMPAWK